MSENTNSTVARELVSIKEATFALNLSRTTLYQLIGNKKLVSVTVGRRRFIPRLALNEFVVQLLRMAKQ
jgi:excisionase family DNA binding protein